MAQQVKDPVLSLLWLWLQLWRGFNQLAQELRPAAGMAKKKKEQRKKNLMELMECSPHLPRSLHGT